VMQPPVPRPHEARNRVKPYFLTPRSPLTRKMRRRKRILPLIPQSHSSTEASMNEPGHWFPAPRTESFVLGGPKSDYA
jgi:hypothetical protein